MNDQQLKEIQQQLFFELGYKVDLYHFENIREIVVIKHNEVLTTTNPIKVFKY